MLPSHRRRGRLTVAVVLAAMVAGSLAADAHHPPPNDDDPHTYTEPHTGFEAPLRAYGRLSPATGALLGVHPEDAHGGSLTDPEEQGIIATENSLGRSMDIDNSYYEFFEMWETWDPAQASTAFKVEDPATWDGRGLSRLAYWDITQGRIPLVGWACQNSENVNSGEYDDIIRTTGEAFKALGDDFFMRYCWEMDGSKRIRDEDDDDGDGNKSELAVGQPEDFIKAWNRIYDIIAAPPAGTVPAHDVPLFSYVGSSRRPKGSGWENVDVDHRPLAQLADGGRVKAENVVWVWCGNAAHFKNTNRGSTHGLGQGYFAWDYYPGDATVDWISSDGYNWALADRNKPSYDGDDWRGFVEIYDDFMVWARWTPASGITPEGMRFDDGEPTGAPEAFPRKGQVKPIMIGEYGIIEPPGGGAPPSQFAEIGPHLTKPNWMIETHDTVNGSKSANWVDPAVDPNGCHWCGIYSDIAAVVYFDINADKDDQNGDWRIISSPESEAAYKQAAADDPWFRHIGNVGWSAAANAKYTSSPPGVWPAGTPNLPADIPSEPTNPTTPTTQPTTPTTTQQGTVTKSGYWMLGAGGAVYPFGEAGRHGDATTYLPTPAQVAAVDVESTPNGAGYWVVDTAGRVFGMGDAGHHGNAPVMALVPGEKITSLSSTPTGKGYWLFTTKGRAIAFGDADHHGDMAAKALNAPVLDSIPTPTGKGYYMVAADGGIFTFGDAKFYGSTGNMKLNAPVQSLVPDPDGKGYWLVASDGGVFSFESGFRGSMGATRLNKPMTGMIPYGTGYLMVAEDGGIFNFSDKPFSGSLGNTKVPHPIVAVAAIK